MSGKFEEARNFIIAKLSSGLNIDLTYHNLEHILDVENAVIRLSRMEDISEEEMILLRTAAVFHDSGMLVTYLNHEEESCRICREILPDYNYPESDIAMITKMIMTTKLPQTAESLMEKLLCDADLDYLGRTDFFMIGQRLRFEWNTLHIKETSLLEWYYIQRDFLSQHEYYTHAAQVIRNDQKNDNLQQIIELLNNQ
ncbi:MAG: HD domain-containing protein [Bacteroidetes bacterium]|nr:HD domain-containing protein [Bacteroidota bacterium]